MEYINENCTAITFETDVFQTWQFQIVYKQSFIEREHVNNESVGANTIPENVETSEYVTNISNYYNSLDTYKYIVQVTEPFGQGTPPALSTNFGMIPMAGDAYICEKMTKLVNVGQSYASEGKEDAIYNVYMCPSM